MEVGYSVDSSYGYGYSKLEEILLGGGHLVNIAERSKSNPIANRMVLSMSILASQHWESY